MRDGKKSDVWQLKKIQTSCFKASPMSVHSIDCMTR